MTEPIKYYTFDKNTDEVEGPFYSDIVAGAHHYPVDSFTMDPPPAQTDMVVVAQRNNEGQPVGYHYIEDHRGKKVWHTENVGTYGTIMEVGTLEEGWAHDEPPSQHHTWDGDAWTLDSEKEYDNSYEKALHLRESDINSQIQPLRNEVMDLRFMGKDDEADEKHELLLAKIDEINNKYPLPDPPDSGEIL